MRFTTRVFTFAKFATCIAMLSAADARADTYTIDAGGNQDWAPTSGGFLQESAFPPVANAGTMSDSSGSASVLAVSDAGSIRAMLSGNHTAAPLFTARFAPHVLASASGTITFSGPAGIVVTRPNFHVSGQITHPDTTAYDLEETNMFFTFSMETVVSDRIFGASVKNGAPAVDVNQFNGFNISTSGSTFSIGGTGTTQIDLNVPVGVPINTRFALGLRNQLLSNGLAGSSSFSADFGSTASWATTGPVFNLPEGYTVNGFGIVDNHFVGIPEPTSIVLCIFGVLSVGVLRDRRRLDPVGGVNK